MFALRPFKADEMIFEAECKRKLKELEDKGLVEKRHWWSMPVTTEDSDCQTVTRRKSLWKRAGSKVMTLSRFSVAGLGSKIASNDITQEASADVSLDADTGEDTVNSLTDSVGSEQHKDG